MKVRSVQSYLRGAWSLSAPMENPLDACELSDVHEGFRERLATVFMKWRLCLTTALGEAQARGEVNSRTAGSAVLNRAAAHRRRAGSAPAAAWSANAQSVLP